MKDDRALELIFATQVERFVKAAAYEAEPAWRPAAIREPSPPVRPAASPSLWEVTQPVFLRVPPAELSRKRCTCIRCMLRIKRFNPVVMAGLAIVLAYAILAIVALANR